MTPPKYVFNHVALFDDDQGVWKIYHKKDKRIPKKVANYGNDYLGKGETITDAVDDAYGVSQWDVQVIE